MKRYNIKKRDLATAYGYRPREVTNILNGTTKGPAANKFVLRVIADYSIE
ncbi:DNA-binding protein [Streptococcus sanguinis]|uniref:DNA-binding protein n=1 Tax=Streptococcus sanguinis TaxID=1305 RepID=A0ABD4VKR1_STRSA|nr:DNA-binding protein [Streptococcus sanguinis]MCY7035300.1 DNA-binding protein [Streptococcus sanguinis]